MPEDTGKPSQPMSIPSVGPGVPAVSTTPVGVQPVTSSAAASIVEQLASPTAPQKAPRARKVRKRQRKTRNEMIGEILRDVGLLIIAFGFLDPIVDGLRNEPAAISRATYTTTIRGAVGPALHLGFVANQALPRAGIAGRLGSPVPSDDQQIPIRLTAEQTVKSPTDAARGSRLADLPWRMILSLMVLGGVVCAWGIRREERSE